MHKANVQEDTRLLRIPDASARSGLGQHDLRGLVAAGEVLYLKRGRTILVDYPDLERWISEQAQRTRAAVE